MTNSTVHNYNKIAGIWRLQSADVISNGERHPILGSTPGGLLIFTKGLQFSMIAHDPMIANFSSGDRMKGSDNENRAYTQGSVAVYGTYRVDKVGDFLDQKVEGSTFPNWNGIERGRDVLRLQVEGDTITEHMVISGGAIAELIWKRSGS